MTPEHLLDEIARVGVTLILNEPYYAHFLANLSKRIDEQIETMAVSVQGDNYVLHVNPRFWQTELTTRTLQVGLLKHEVLHLVFKHPTRMRNYPNPFLYNVACDLVVNQYIDRAALPASAIYPDTFTELELLPFESSDYYYNQLHQHQCQCPDSPLSQRLNELETTCRAALERHASWGLLARKSGVECSVFDVQLDNLVRVAIERTGAKGIGKLPARLQRHLETFRVRPEAVINWRKLLRVVAESSRRTQIRNTLKRPSKRFGTTPGIRVKHHHRVLVAIDTSGSINMGELALFFSEVHHLWRTGSEVRVVECDADIGKMYDYRGILPTVVTGGGGTDFTPPIHYANTHYHPDLLIYFTDAYGATAEPCRTPVLWVVSQAGADPTSNYFQNLPGRKVKLTVN